MGRHILHLRFDLLLEHVHAAATTPAGDGTLTAVSRASLQTDLANALERNNRLAARVRQLEKAAVSVDRREGLGGFRAWSVGRC
jgi:uncharacterized protein YlxW (UPF0749 family)